MKKLHVVSRLVIDYRSVNHLVKALKMGRNISKVEIFFQMAPDYLNLLYWQIVLDFFVSQMYFSWYKKGHLLEQALYSNEKPARPVSMMPDYNYKEDYGPLIIDSVVQTPIISAPIPQTNPGQPHIP